MVVRPARVYGIMLKRIAWMALKTRVMGRVLPVCL